MQGISEKMNEFNHNHYFSRSHISTIHGDHLKPAYEIINRHHFVPTLIADDELVWDSHAINAFLVNKFGKTDSLYPTEAVARAKVDQMLHFDTSTLYPGFRGVVHPVCYRQEREWSAASVETAAIALRKLEAIIENSDYVAGSHVTIADFSCVASVTFLFVLGLIDDSEYPRLCAWITRMEQIPYYREAIGDALKQIPVVIKKILEKNVQLAVTKLE